MKQNEDNIIMADEALEKAVSCALRLGLEMKFIDCYFTFDRNEIDFVIQNKNRIIPIEVKANKSTNNTSLTRYNEKFDNDISIRFSMNNLEHYLKLYLAY